MATWRPANIKNLPGEAAHVINQLVRETNQRIDDLAKRTPIHQQLKGSAQLNFGSVPANSTVERTINVVGGNQGSVVHVSPQLLPGTHLSWSSYMKSNGQISVVLTNPTSSPITASTINWNWMIHL